MLPTITISLLFQSLIPVIIINLLIYAFFILSLIRDDFNTSHLPLFGMGIPNLITIGRGIAVIVVILSYPQLSNLVVSSLLFIIYLLDKVDGISAKLLNQQSRVGEIMDIESDAFLTVYILYWLYFEGVIAPWLVAIAFLRYTYVIVLELIDLAVKKEYRRQFSAIVSTVFIILLIWVWALPFPEIYLAINISGLFIFFTFIRDFLNRIM